MISKYNINIENCSFLYVFAFYFFHPFFQGGQLIPFAPICGRPCGCVAVELGGDRRSRRRASRLGTATSCTSPASSVVGRTSSVSRARPSTRAPVHLALAFTSTNAPASTNSSAPVYKVTHSLGNNVDASNTQGDSHVILFRIYTS